MALPGLISKAKGLISQIGSSDLMNDTRIVQALNALKQRLASRLQGVAQEDLYSKAQQVWNLAQGDPRVFISYLQSVPDPQLNALIQNRAQLNDIVRRLVESQSLERTQAPGDGIPPAPLQSSNVAGFQYDKNNSQLRVKFHNGGVYQYEGVPDWVYSVFSRGAVPAKTSGKNKYGTWWVGKNPSLGAALNQMIKIAGFPYQKIA